MKMKYLPLFAAALFVCQMSYAQTWFELGAKGGFGPTALWESNISDSDLHDMNINSGYKYGLNVTTNFDNGGAVVFELLFANSKQTYDFDGLEPILSGTNSVEWKSTNLYLLYRMVNRGAFFEIGPKMSFINSVDQTLGNFEFDGIDDAYADNYFSGVLGFGGYLFGSRDFTLGLGLRVEYAFQNFTSSTGRDNNYPLPYDPTYDAGNLRNINVYGTLEFKIPIGRIARIKCGQRGFLFGGG